MKGWWRGSAHFGHGDRQTVVASSLAHYFSQDAHVVTLCGMQPRGPFTHFTPGFGDRCAECTRRAMAMKLLRTPPEVSSA